MITVEGSRTVEDRLVDSKLTDPRRGARRFQQKYGYLPDSVIDTTTGTVWGIVGVCEVCGVSVQKDSGAVCKCRADELMAARPEPTEEKRAALVEYAESGEVVPDRVLYVLAALAVRTYGGKDR